MAEADESNTLDMAHALEHVQQVTGTPAFAALSADPQQRQEAATNPVAALRARGVALPASIRRIEVKRRHTTKAAWARGARGGGVEWRFHVEAGRTTFRIIVICDPWPTDDPTEAAPQEMP